MYKADSGGPTCAVSLIVLCSTRNLDSSFSSIRLEENNNWKNYRQPKIIIVAIWSVLDICIFKYALVTRLREALPLQTDVFHTLWIGAVEGFPYFFNFRFGFETFSFFLRLFLITSVTLLLDRGLSWASLLSPIHTPSIPTCLAGSENSTLCAAMPPNSRVSEGQLNRVEEMFSWCANGAAKTRPTRITSKS